jgi:energy-coupling factor transporter transmembrane protein EcfT
MVSLSELWLPIVVSGVVLWFGGFIFWMVLPHHRSDWKPLPDENGLMAELRRQGAAGPAQHQFPYCKDSKAMKDAEWKRKMEAGPSGMLVLFKPGPPSMGLSMVLYLVQCLVVSLFVAYLAGHVLAPGTEYLQVFRVVGTAGILAWVGALPTAAIWFGRSWSSICKEILDGIVYGLLMAGIFGWLWP